MKLEILSAEANSIWKKAAGTASSEHLRLQLELYKKLLNFFQVGPYYYLIFNVPILDLEYASNEMTNVLGYQPAELNMAKYLEISHPDDRPYFLSFENKAAEFLTALPIDKLMKYKIQYDLRLRRQDGKYIRVLHQCAVIEHDDKGGLVRTLGVHTDISHLKPEGHPVFSIIGMDGEPSYVNIDVKKVFEISLELFTKREKEILTLMIEGQLSKEIAASLFISKETVDKHRKNMLSKHGFRNTSELVSFAVRNGVV